MVEAMVNQMKPMLPQARAVDDDGVTSRLMHQQGVRTAKVKLSMIGVVCDVLMVLLPLLFIVLAGAAAFLHGHKTSNTGDAVKNTLLLAPTVFPIVFAAIVGHAMRRMALYTSQTGLELKLLEHLAGSQSLFSSLERLISLRNFGLVGLTVTIFWLLSPLGGQALLRLLSIEDSLQQENFAVSYLSPWITDGSSSLSGASSGGSTLTMITAAYLSTLLMPMTVQNSTRDQWGNPKTPARSSWGGAIATGDEWSTVPNPSFAPPAYQSLIGVPINVTYKGTSSFIVTTLQMEFSECSTTISNDTLFLESVGTVIPYLINGSIPKSSGMQTGGIPSSFFVTTAQSWSSFVQTPFSSPLDVYYGSRTETGTDQSWPAAPLSLINCALAPIYLDANVSCSSGDCSVVAVRHAPQDGFSNATWASLENLFSDPFWTGMGASLHPAEASITDVFLMDPAAASQAYYGYVDLWSLQPDVIAERLGLAFNAFYYCQATRSVLLGSDFGADAEALNQTTSAQGTRSTGLIYRCHKRWLVVVLAICIALELAAVIGAILGYMITVPDVFGYVSSMVLDNEHCRRMGIVESSALDGLTRARKLGHLRFRIADVSAEGDIGHFSFIPDGHIVGHTRVSTARARRPRTREYD